MFRNLEEVRTAKIKAELDAMEFHGDENEEEEEDVISKLITDLKEEISYIQEQPAKRKTKNSAKNDHTSNLSDKLQLVKTEIQKMQQDLSEREKSLQDQKMEVENQEAHIRSVNLQFTDQDVLKLNVGGTIFDVNARVLCKYKDSIFPVLFGNSELGLKPTDGVYFIDRDPTHFDHILSFLKDDTAFVIPESEQVRNEVLKEAAYYKIRPLIFKLQSSEIREKELGPGNIAMRDAENEVRFMFVKDPKNPIIQDPYCHLINVFENVNSFKFPSEDEIGKLPSIPLILNKKRKIHPGQLAIENANKYKMKFDSITEHLRELDWSNVFVAGGSILGCLLPNSDTKFGGSDIDVFLYGLNEEQATKKVVQIYDALKAVTKEVIVVRTMRTLTFAFGFPWRHVQIVLRLYNSPAEVLLGFDLDCVGCGYDGKNVWCLPRTRRALTLRYNIADPSRQTFRTTSYEYRLWKYSKRGFGVAVPGFRRHHIDASIYAKQLSHLEGFAKLLYFEERDYQCSLIKKTTSDWFTRHGFPLHRDVPEAPLVSLKKEDMDAAVHLVDYNQVEHEWFCSYQKGVLIPFSPLTTYDYIVVRLGSRLLQQAQEFKELLVKSNIPDDPVCDEVIADKSKKDKKRHVYLNPPQQPDEIDAYYVFGTLEEVMDISNFQKRLSSLNSEVAKLKVRFHLPKHLEFLGSLAEYMQSLPKVEDDWYRCATVKNSLSF